MSSGRTISRVNRDPYYEIYKRIESLERDYERLQDQIDLLTQEKSQYQFVEIPESIDELLEEGQMIAASCSNKE